MSLKVQTSNITNKTDPKSRNSRVFIGNLNTALVNKSDVEGIFSQYGRVLGCSVHKGYAFVQYASERHARAAVLGENGRVLAGQTLDINMAGEPRPSRAKALKRSAASLYSGYELDYDFYREDFYDRLFEYRSRVSPVPRVVPVVPVKRPRALPLLHRVKGLPMKILRSSTVHPHSRLKGSELQAIKTELTQIKANIEALLGRLETLEEHNTGTESRKGCGAESEDGAWPEEEEEELGSNAEDEAVSLNSEDEEERGSEEETDQADNSTQPHHCENHTENYSTETAGVHP
ncbi:RNA-binding protein Raly [Boleophthalmus pectinirostris]|uniref:RNA-binding protein Raly n=1 Tax=Boleophthalmus pectinirostris TaxID=150288 RepID=UPI002433090C|nr:RNA-binding protein Raly [Boleophthalmus pectinirostris]